MDLANLRLPHAMQAELRWVFSEADGDIGLTSNYGAMVGLLEVGSRSGSSQPAAYEIDVERIEAAGRERRIRLALDAIGHRHAQVLRVQYGPGRAPELPAFGELAGLAMFTSAAHRAHQASGTNRSLPDWLARLAERVRRNRAASDVRDLMVVNEIRREAEALLVAASGAYARARRAACRRSS